MIEQISNSIKFICFYTASKQGKTGLTVTCDVYKNGTLIVTAGACTEIGGGLYSYTLASGSVDAEGDYLAVLKTADATVDVQWIPALWLIQKAGVENLDASASSIKAKTDNLPSDPADQSAVEAAITAGIATLPTVGQIEDGVLDALTADHVTAGTIGKAIGDAGSGSVVVNARVAVSAVEAASVASGKLGFVRYYSFAESIPSDTTEALNTATEIWLAIKHSKDDSDASSILLVSKTNGLEVLNGSAYGTPAHGSLSIAGISGDWDADVDVTHDVTPSLPLGTYYAELKALLANGRTIQAWAGKADVKEGLIKAIA
jgi:hypothetical protein